MRTNNQSFRQSIDSFIVTQFNSYVQFNLINLQYDSLISLTCFHWNQRLSSKENLREDHQHFFRAQNHLIKYKPGIHASTCEGLLQFRRHY